MGSRAPSPDFPGLLADFSWPLLGFTWPCASPGFLLASPGHVLGVSRGSLGPIIRHSVCCCVFPGFRFSWPPSWVILYNTLPFPSERCVWAGLGSPQAAPTTRISQTTCSANTMYYSVFAVPAANINMFPMSAAFGLGGPYNAPSPPPQHKILQAPPPKTNPTLQ